MKVDVDISLQAAVAILTKFQELQQRKSLAAVSLSALPTETGNNATTSSTSSSSAEESNQRDVELPDDVTDDILDITVISAFAPAVQSVSNASAVSIATGDSYDVDVDNGSSGSTSVSVSVGNADLTLVAQGQEPTLDSLLRNLSGSRIHMTFEDYPQLAVAATLEPASAASQLIVHKDIVDSPGALVTALSELFNQTSSSLSQASSELSTPRALTLSLTTSGSIESEMFGADNNTVTAARKQTAGLVKDMLRVMVKTLLASESEELLPSQISAENIRVQFVTDLS